IQDNIFFFRVSVSGTVFHDLNRNGRQDFGEPGLAGWTVQLFDVSGGTPQLVATTTTNASGTYRFNVFDGLGTGRFQVVETLPAGWAPTTANPRNLSIPRGETNPVVNFGNYRTFGPGGGDSQTPVNDDATEVAALRRNAKRVESDVPVTSDTDGG